MELWELLDASFLQSADVRVGSLPSRIHRFTWENSQWFWEVRAHSESKGFRPL
jgi:hypothetical protein